MGRGGDGGLSRDFATRLKQEALESGHLSRGKLWRLLWWEMIRGLVVWRNSACGILVGALRRFFVPRTKTRPRGPDSHVPFVDIGRPDLSGMTKVSLVLVVVQIWATGRTGHGGFTAKA